MQHRIAGTVGRPRSESARRAILAAAYALVAAEGYQAVTTAAIAAKAGTGKQTIYRWWPTKAALVLEALREHDGNPEKPDSSLETLLHRLMAVAVRSERLLRSVMAEAQSDAGLLQDLKEALVMRQKLALAGELFHAGVPQARIGTLMDAIYGMLWHRLLSGSLDEDFVGDAGGLVASFRADDHSASL